MGRRRPAERDDRVVGGHLLFTSTLCVRVAAISHLQPRLPRDAPPAERRWRVKVYVMPNDPEALLARVAEDFPSATELKDKRVPAE